SLLIIVVWELYGRTTSSLVFPSFSEVLYGLYDMFVVTANIYSTLGLTLQQLFIGYLLAVAVALPVGLIMGTSDIGKHVLDPYVNILFVTSVTSLLPFLIIIFGTDLAFRVSVVFLFGVFHMTLNFQAAMENVNEELVNAGRCFGAKGKELYRHVRIPAALPLIIAGLRLGIGRSIKGMVVAELWIFSGIGFLLHTYQQSLAVGHVFALVLVLMLLGVTAVRGLYFLEDRFAPWQAAKAD
ncbi:MAG: ABC transporter permease subunit, partial [Haloarculaceae archaeon]